MICRSLARIPFTLQRSFSLSACQLQFAERLYTKKHEWISVSGSVGTVGISDFAQSELGDVVYAELPEVGLELNKGDSIGVIESVKSASDVYSPVTGKITAINDKIESSPQLINKSTYEEGWLFKVELKNAEELKELMDEAAYKQYRDQEKEEE
uniref:Glycine cleavage system H protein n=1 Tax=Steinernema glaseri TaxID=37863 RepID=A0A1I8A5G6_9BILA